MTRKSEFWFCSHKPTFAALYAWEYTIPGNSYKRIDCTIHGNAHKGIAQYLAIHTKRDCTIPGNAKKADALYLAKRTKKLRYTWQSTQMDCSIPGNPQEADAQHLAMHTKR